MFKKDKVVKLLKIFKTAFISGSVFVKHGRDAGFFENKCNLPVGISYELADLAKEIAEGQTTGIKSKLLLMPRTSRRLQADNATGNRQQAGDAEMSDTASKKPRLESERDGQLQKLAESARRQRELIRQKIEELNQSSVSFSEDVVPPSKDVLPSEDVIPRSNSVIQLSNPTFDTKLPFPFVGGRVPRRFKVNRKDDERKWFYMGREKFAELRDKFEQVLDDEGCTDLTIYGTRGYGKPHLLAAFVCCLSATEQKVVYIPDCQYFLKRSSPTYDIGNVVCLGRR